MIWNITEKGDCVETPSTLKGSKGYIWEICHLEKCLIASISEKNNEIKIWDIQEKECV